MSLDLTAGGICIGAEDFVPKKFERQQTETARIKDALESKMHLGEGIVLAFEIKFWGWFFARHSPQRKQSNVGHSPLAINCTVL